MSSLKKKWAMEVDRMITPNVMPKLSVGRIGRETSDKITRSFDEYERAIIMSNRTIIPVADIIQITGNCFDDMELF